jgi:uncharacterized protein YcfJ
MKMTSRKLLSAAASLMLGAGVVGCESHAGTGALIGGAAGAGIGAIVGHNSHGRTGSGALIGGAVGAGAGALIGNEQDKAEQRDRGYRRDDYRRDDYRRDDYEPRSRYYERDDSYAPRYDGGYTEYRTYRSGPYGSSYYESRRYNY